MRRIAWYGTILALVHLFVILLHGRTHPELQTGLGPLQTLFVIGVIAIGPRLAMLLLRQKRNLKKILDSQEKPGFVLLKIPMPSD